jgi:hypothetical protein
MPDRANIASKCAESPEGTKAYDANAAATKMNGRPCGGSIFRSLTTVFFSWRIYFEATARQAEGVKRSGDAGHECRVDKISAAPADAFDQEMGHRPAHG